MKAKLTIASSLTTLLAAARQPEFYRDFFGRVLQEHLGVKNPIGRPAAYFAQTPDEMLVLDEPGVIFQLTGISRDGREPKQFHDAYTAAVDMVKAFVAAHVPKGMRVQVSVQFCLDGQIPVAKGQGSYSSIIDTAEVWVDGTADDADEAS